MRRRRIFGVALSLVTLAACGREPASPRAGLGKSPATTADAVANHDSFAAQGLACATCHPCGQAATHAAAWMDRTSPGFHAIAADSGLGACQACHGDKLDGAGGTAAVSCATCHGASWPTNCTMCHGGADNPTGAPPGAIWGKAGDPGRGGGTIDAVRIGAHTSHLSARHALAAPVACSSCHVVPADAFAPGHLDGSTATVTFSGIAALGTPSWARATATCASYCHGATLGGGTVASPVWTTTDGSQIACGSCHGLPPPAPHVQSSA
jgi:predicted CxxxxCH...CXXCH cytochrome family protein